MQKFDFKTKNSPILKNYLARLKLVGFLSYKSLNQQKIDKNISVGFL